MCQDFWRRGYNKIVLDPSIFVVYKEDSFEGKKKDFGYQIKQEDEQIRPHHFVSTPPQKVVCCELLDSFARDSSRDCKKK